MVPHHSVAQIQSSTTILISLSLCYTCNKDVKLTLNQRSLMKEKDRTNVSYDVPESNEKFLDYSPWVTTIVFLAFTLAFQTIAAGLCALNTYTVPIEIWLGPMGIYIANGATGIIIS